MKSGNCPKCEAQTVYRKRDGIGFGGGGTFVYTRDGASASDVDYYVCTTCGYFEAYIADEEKLMDVGRYWWKVK